MAITHLKQNRRSRWNPQPKKDCKGKSIPLRIRQRDVLIFQILDRYRYLPTSYIYRLLPEEVRGNETWFKNRLTDLTGNKFLKRPKQQQANYAANYTELVYELGLRGIQYLREVNKLTRHCVGYANPYLHEVLICKTIACLEILCKETPGYTFIPWQELLLFKQVPQATKNAQDPFLMTAGTGCIRPDGLPFVIRIDDANGKQQNLCFPGIEVDMGTEVLGSRSSSTRTSLRNKFKGYIEIAKKRVYTSHFGFPNMLVPFISTSTRRMNNMEKVLLEESNNQGVSFIFFMSIDQLESNPTPQHYLDFYSAPWQRVGHPDFCLFQ